MIGARQVREPTGVAAFLGQGGLGAIMVFLARYRCPAWAWRALTTVVLGCAASCPAGAEALVFEAREADLGTGVRVAEIVARGEVILRLRSDTAGDVLGRAQGAATLLNEVCVAGLKPDQVRVAGSRHAPQLQAGSKTLLAADADTARLSQSDPRALAESWAARLRSVLSGPYLALAPGLEILVPVGETRELKVGGTVIGEPSAEGYRRDILAVQVAGPKALRLEGRATGETKLTVRRGESTATVTVCVRHWAARWPQRAVARLTGDGVSAEVRAMAIRNAALAGCSPAAEALLRVLSVTPVPEGTGYEVAVDADGENLIPSKGAVRVSVESASVSRARASRLLVSNDPERVDTERSLLFAPLEEAEAVRLLYHHRNVARGKLVLHVALLNLGEDHAEAHLVSAAKGPSSDELFVGHAAARAFLGDQRAGRGCVLRLPPGRVAYLVAEGMPSNQVVSGLAELNVLRGRDVFIEVFSVRQNMAALSDLPPAPETGEDLPPETPHSYEPSKRLECHHTAGDRWAFVDLGRQGTDSDAGTTLRGDYGVFYRIEATVENPRGAPVQAEIAVRGSAGAARGVFFVDGVVHETKVLRGGSEEVLARFRLGPRSKRVLTIETMPESASNYPVTLILRTR